MVGAKASYLNFERRFLSDFHESEWGKTFGLCLEEIRIRLLSKNGSDIPLQNISTLKYESCVDPGDFFLRFLCIFYYEYRAGVSL